MQSQDETYALDAVRARNQERALAFAFAPAARRRALFAVAAFDTELEKTAETVSEPMLGQIRLAWWREAVAEISEGDAPRRHPVVAELAAVAGRTTALRARLEGLIDARERELDPARFQTRADLRAHLADIGAGWAQTVSRVCDAVDASAGVDALGEAAAWARELERVGARLAGGVCLLPAEDLAAAGLSRDGLLEERGVDALPELIRSLAETEGRDAVARARSIGATPPALSPLAAGAASAAIAIDRLAAGRSPDAPVLRRLAMVRAAARGGL
ncbi:MAG: squalene/phytoene synthase family protein [Pseudomonadota bacterium]